MPAGYNDDPGLSGKVAIIAGGGAAGDGIGNGRAASLLLASSSTKVLVVDRELALAQRTVDMITAEGGTAAAHAADLTDEKQCKTTVEAAVDRFGRLDFLDNNIGISSRGTVVTEPQETWHRMMQVNVEAMFLTSKYAIPAMSKSAGGAPSSMSPRSRRCDRVASRSTRRPRPRSSA